MGINTVSANEYNLDFKANLIDSNSEDLNSTQDILFDKQLAIQVTITNPNNIWIDIKSLTWTSKLVKTNDNFDNIIVNKEITDLLIPPYEQHDFYIILNKYNKLNTDTKIGQWQINFNKQIKVENAYSTDFEPIGFNEKNIIIANPISFKITKPDLNPPDEIVETGFLDRFNPSLDDAYKLVGIVTMVIGVIIGVIKLKSGKSKRKR